MSIEEIEHILGNINYEVKTQQEWVEPLGLDRDTWENLLEYIYNKQNKINDLERKNKKLKEENAVLKTLVPIVEHYSYGIR